MAQIPISSGQAFFSIPVTAVVFRYNKGRVSAPYFSWSQFEASPPVYPADWTVEREFDLTVYEEISKTSWFRHYNSDSGNTIWI